MIAPRPFLLAVAEAGGRLPLWKPSGPRGRRSLPRWLAVAMLIPSVSGAQALSAGGSLWHAAGSGATPSRTGLRAAAAMDWTAGGAGGAGAGFRLEAAYVQGYHVVRTAGQPNQKLNENAIEVAGVVRTPRLGGAGLRGFIGPVMALGQACGSSSRPLPCPDDRWSRGRTRVGAAAGVERGWKHNALEVVADLRAQWFTSDREAGRGPALTAGGWLRLPR